MLENGRLLHYICLLAERWRNSTKSSKIEALDFANYGFTGKLLLPSFTLRTQQLWRALNPRRSLRARMALTFGLLVILLTIGLVVSLEFTVADDAIDPNMLINQLQRQIWVSGLILTLTFIAAGWIIAGRIAQPLRIIAEAARDQRKDGQNRVIPTFPGQDEVASLSRSLNLLVANLRTQQNALREINDRLEQRVAERTSQLAALYDVLEISSGMQELPVLLQRALARVLQTSRAEVGCIHLIDQDGQQMTMAAHFQLSEKVAASYAHIPHDHPIAQETLRQESHLLLSNLQEEPDISAFLPLTNNQQALCLPIRKAERSLGVLTILANGLDFFDDDAIALLSSLADQLGIAIENDRLRQQAEQLAIVNERNRLARELHDSVTQALYSATLFAEAGQKQARAGHMDKALTNLDDVLETSRQALKEMRLLVHKLRPSTLEREGLIHALDQRLKAVEGRAGIKQKLAVSGSRVFSAEIEETLYHIAVEALNNSLKHAQSTAVTVNINQTNTAITLQITDDGQGFEKETAVSSGGLGLTSMQERVKLHGGSLTIESAPNQGTSITAVLPNK